MRIGTELMLLTMRYYNGLKSGRAKMKFLSFGICVLMLLPSCGGSGEQQKTSQTGEGGIEYGHVFRINEVLDIRSMHPLNITEVAAFRVASQVYEGLVKFDQATLEVVPGLAENWEVNDDASQWTFHLREGVRFHDDPCFGDGKGREVTAEDVAWCVKQLCTPSSNNQMFWLVDQRIKGAREYFDAQMKSPDDSKMLEGIEVIDDHTVRFHLTYPFSGFLQLLGHNGFYVYPKESAERYGDELRAKAVGTGPFVMKVFKDNELVVLERNPNYWKKDDLGNSLPYLDAIQVSFVKEKKAELLKFRNGELDMVFTLPVEMYSEVMSGLSNANRDERVGFSPQVKPSLSVEYYAFQHTSEIFSDVRIRKAFNYAINRKALVNYALQGEGEPGTGGIVPPAFKEYAFKSIRGFSFDPEKAQKLLAEAGYPNGEGFPELTLELASGGQNHEIVAQVVQRMLKENLNIDVELQVMSMAQLLDNAESGRAKFWRDAWVADYPDPENFLCLFLSSDKGFSSEEKTYMNSVRYHNPVYDSLYATAVRETDRAKRYSMYLSLDQMLMNDAVVMPLYYEEFTRLIPNYVHNFPQNGIEYRDFSEVWISSAPTKSEE